MNFATVLSYESGKIFQTYGPDDVKLLALACGLGQDFKDFGQLKFVTGSSPVVFPIFADVIASPPFWVQDAQYEIDWPHVLHAEERIRFHKAMPPEGQVSGTAKVKGIVDHGSDRGAMVYVERGVSSAAGNMPYATILQTLIFRGDGGSGSTMDKPADLVTPPNGPATVSEEFTCNSQTTLLFELTGGGNPIHYDPVEAKAAGFDAPILHGKCILGMAMHAVVKHVCDYDVNRLRSFDARFSGIMYPGETLHTDIWKSNLGVYFESTALDRNEKVLTRGFAELS